jgi:hypothetical protein
MNAFLLRFYQAQAHQQPLSKSQLAAFCALLESFSEASSSLLTEQTLLINLGTMCLLNLEGSRGLPEEIGRTARLLVELAFKSMGMLKLETEHLAKNEAVLAVLCLCSLMGANPVTPQLTHDEIVSTITEFTPILNIDSSP